MKTTFCLLFQTKVEILCYSDDVPVLICFSILIKIVYHVNVGFIGECW